MIYLATNHSRVTGLRAKGFPIGWLLSPGGWRSPGEIPFGVDNAMYHAPDEPPVGMKGLPPFYRLCDRLASEGWAPLFVTIPDVPYCGAESLVLSRKHAGHLIREYPAWPLALAVQDGMSFEVLREWPEVSWIFVGGSTDWKLATAPRWVQEAHALGKRCHVARVNSGRRLRLCLNCGADSADGTGAIRYDADRRVLLRELGDLHLFRPTGKGAPA